MKRFPILTGIILTMAVFFCSCEDYLEKTPDAELSEEEIFGTYQGFQGFTDVLYGCVIDPNSHALTTGSENGDHSIANEHQASARKFAEGRYWDVIFNTWQSNYWTNNEWSVFGVQTSGIWQDGWKGIRVANICLEKLHMLNGTQEQINLIKGQAYFFRAYLHWEIITRWGGIPYIDEVIDADVQFTKPRLTFQGTAERIIEDFEHAAELLPEDWDQTTVGSSRIGFNSGRATKGAALAYKTRALLYAGSPLMVKDGGGSYEFDAEYMKRAANAAWEVIKLTNKGVYGLVPFEEYQNLYAKIDGTIPWTKETIWAKIPTRLGKYTAYGPWMQNSRHGRLYTPARFGGNAICETPVQNLVDAFEMNNGLPIDDIESGYNSMDPWSNRDPRFRRFILVDGDMAGIAASTQVQLYQGGLDKNEAGVLTSYLQWKYWPKGANRIDNLWTLYTYLTPLMRLSDIYLIYAEAVNEAYGPNGTADGSGLTAVDAINIVRNRSGMPPVAAKFTGSKDAFRERIRNERSVELCFEGSRWFDIRRWYIAHLPENKVQYDLEFDKNHTYFNRVVRFNRVFDQRHYWMPFYKSQTQIYPGWPQNPGW